MKFYGVLPIPKEINTNIPDNFGPVLLLSVVYKIFEKAIYTQLLNYLESNTDSGTDFSETFDLVDHSILCQKPWFHSVRENELTLCAN